MSFRERHDKVQKGDTVVLFLGHNSMQSVKMVAGRVHQTKFGAFPHNNIIGREFGSKVYSSTRKSWVHILHPSPELWTVTLPHRTQIVYTTDISLVTLELELRPGSVMIESGTGSGSASHAFIRSIMPSGHLYTFDFHEQRAEQVFLDLPKPWVAIKYAKEALKVSGGRLCSFSPCIEQVQRTSEELRKSGFCEIKTVECLCKTFDVRTVPFPKAKFSKSELSSEEDQNEKHHDATTDESADNGESSQLTPSLTQVQSAGDNKNSPTQKRSQSLKRGHSDSQNEETRTPHHKIQKPGYENTLTARAVKEIPGHTGYLTFATLLPVFTAEH